MKERGDVRVEVRQFFERRPRVGHPYGDFFMMLSQRGVAELSERLEDRTLGMQAVRVLLAMMRHMDFENRVDVSQKNLALALGMGLSDLSRASKVLVECGLVERMANRRGWYRISPRLCWKGTAKKLEEELRPRAPDSRSRASTQSAAP